MMNRSFLCFSVPADASQGYVDFVNWFTDIKTSLTGDFTFYLFIIGAVVVLYWIARKTKALNKLVKRPAAKLLALAVLGFVLLMIIVPLLTVPADATQGYIDFVNFFVDIKVSLTGDLSFYVLLLVFACGGWIVLKNQKLI